MKQSLWFLVLIQEVLLNITRTLSEEKFVETGLSHRKPHQPLIVMPGERTLRY